MIIVWRRIQHSDDKFKDAIKFLEIGIINKK